MLDPEEWPEMLADWREEREISMAPKIIDCSITPKFGLATIHATFDNGEETDLLSYYTDEISFNKEEIIGKTAAEVRKLHFDKDLRYLRS